MMRSSIFVFCLLLISPLLNATQLEFSDTRIPEAPPGAQTMAAYMRILNNSNKTRSITAISSDECAKVEIHQSSIDKGIASMQQIDALVIPAHGTLDLKPGGIHLMLIEPIKNYMRDELITLHLIETDGTEHALVISVKKIQEPEHRHHHE